MQGPPVRLDGVSPGPLPPARQAATASPDGAHDSRGKQVPSLPLRGPAGGLASGPALPLGRAVTLPSPTSDCAAASAARPAGGRVRRE